MDIGKYSSIFFKFANLLSVFSFIKLLRFIYPLHQAIQTGQLEVVKRLLSEPDNDPNKKNEEGDTALHIAITRTDLIIRPNDNFTFFYRTELFRYFQRIGNE
jgi:hypothetical protein